MSTPAAGEAAQLGPPSTPAAGEAAQPGQKSLSAVSWFFKDVSEGLLLTGVLTYGLLYLAYEEFYNNFGVSLDELGIGYPQLLAKGAAGFAVLLLFSLLTVGASIFIWGALLSDAWARMSSSKALKRLLRFLASPLMRLVLVVAGAALFFWGPAWLRVILILSLAVYGLVPILRRTYASGDSSSSHASASLATPGRRLTVAILATTVIAVLGAGVTLIAAAHGDAAMIKKGKLPVSGLPVSISSWGARDAVLIPLTPAADKAYASVAGHKLMYLGAGQDRFILFDIDKQRTIRIPSRDLVVSTEP
jgi:hypothetical protein